jgi:hypothetical protein
MDCYAPAHGIELLWNEVDVNVVVETNYKAPVELWKARDHDRLEIAMVLADIQELTRNFFSFSLVHVKRGANWATHLCARHAVHHRSSNVFLEQCLC